MKLDRLGMLFGFKTNREWLKATLEGIRDGFAILGIISIFRLFIFR